MKLRRVVNTERVQPFEGAAIGSSPNALAFGFGQRLFVSLGTNNAVAVYRASYKQPEQPGPSDLDRSEGPKLTLQGLIPTGWFPGNIRLDLQREQLVVANVKGIGALGEPMISHGLTGRSVSSETGTVSLIPVPGSRQLRTYTEAVLQNNHAPSPDAAQEARRGAAPHAIPRVAGEPSLIKHVFLIIKENRTYDQVLGDEARGNGDASLTIFGRTVTPNHHALSRRFPLLDNFYSSGVQSADGHQWVDQAMAPNYVERNGTDVARSYPYNGGDPLAAGGGGFFMG